MSEYWYQPHTVLNVDMKLLILRYEILSPIQDIKFFKVWFGIILGFVYFLSLKQYLCQLCFIAPRTCYTLNVYRQGTINHIRLNEAFLLQLLFICFQYVDEFQYRPNHHGPPIFKAGKNLQEEIRRSGLRQFE